jgi:hypothetical protein
MNKERSLKINSLHENIECGKVVIVIIDCFRAVVHAQNFKNALVSLQDLPAINKSLLPKGFRPNAMRCQLNREYHLVFHPKRSMQVIQVLGCVNQPNIVMKTPCCRELCRFSFFSFVYIVRHFLS